jgi:predicted house-cleaning NTP pyrophosphatase (Maf/HAM1 superfamily)
VQFEVQGSTFAEDLDKSTFATPQAYTMENAKIKALDVLSQYKVRGPMRSQG